MASRSEAELAKALHDCLVSPNEMDLNLEPANVVDGLYEIARAIHRVADALKQQGGPRLVIEDPGPKKVTITRSQAASEVILKQALKQAGGWANLVIVDDSDAAPR